MKRRAALFATEFESFKDAQEFVGDFRECRGSVATLYKSLNDDFSFPAEVAEMLEDTAEAGTGVGDEGAGVADGEVDQPASSFGVSMSGPSVAVFDLCVLWPCEAMEFGNVWEFREVSTGFRARPMFTFGSKAVRRLIGSRFACGRFPPGSFRYKVRDLAPAYMTCMERTKHSPETVWSPDQNFGFLLVPIQGLLERYACLETFVLGVSQVNLRLLWLIAIGFSAGRAMDFGIALLSGAVAWASDSDSLFVEPSGVL
ncbi:hypothetical protein DY000_02017519 [Brassica cretica]|uniref:Uncharacterized protein n=1 Tax=Brassica cretica TaxID=69181 RepID=A0ABQ7CWT5_BRACR|nr:hypothetical protein DY000_02017519 [Brassica cretica]